MTLPVVDEIDALASHRARADWLIRAPDIVIGGHYAAIRAGLERTGFSEGVAFLAVRHAVVNAVRGRNGRPPLRLRQALRRRMRRMVDAAKGRDGGTG